jgi:hypothetical protein
MRKRIPFTLLGTSILVFLFVLLTPLQSLARSVRSVEADDSNVIVVNTAIGFSTILEFQAKPISAVLGDQDSFKLEYVGNSITIKPLVNRAKSNLFVFTEYERFNCQVVTVPAAQVDYIVRIRAKMKAYPVQVDGAPPQAQEPQDNLVTKPVGKSTSYGGFTLTVISSSHARDLSNPRSVTLIDFALSSKRSPYSFGAGSVGVKQAGKYLDIESVYLDGLKLTPGAPPIHGKLALLSQDFKARLPVTLVFAVPASNKSQGSHRIEVSTASAVVKVQESKKTDEKGK